MFKIDSNWNDQFWSKLLKPPPYFPVNLFPLLCTAFMFLTKLDRSVQRENMWERDSTGQKNRTVPPTKSLIKFKYGQGIIKWGNTCWKVVICREIRNCWHHSSLKKLLLVSSERQWAKLVPVTQGSDLESTFWDLQTCLCFSAWGSMRNVECSASFSFLHPTYPSSSDKQKYFVQFSGLNSAKVSWVLATSFGLMPPKRFRYGEMVDVMYSTSVLMPGELILGSTDSLSPFRQVFRISF